TAFVGMQSWAASTDSWNVELWPDPVETQKLLQKISAKIRKYIVLRPEALIATALWTMTAWAHEGATHSPILAAISVEPDSGKSTLLGVLRFLVPTGCRQSADQAYRGARWLGFHYMLRHGCGYALANAGHDTRAIQDWLGHRSIQHTVRYTEFAPTRLKDFWREVD